MCLEFPRVHLKSRWNHIFYFISFFSGFFFSQASVVKPASPYKAAGMRLGPAGVCFAADNFFSFLQGLAALGVAHRQLLRRVIGPPAGMDWSLRELRFLWAKLGLKPWPHTCLEQQCTLAHYAEKIPCESV